MIASSKKTIKTILLLLLVTAMVILSFITVYLFNNKDYKTHSPMIITIPKKHILDKYSFENLPKINIAPGVIEMKNIEKENNKFNSYLFSFKFDPNLDGKTYKKTTGQINLPNAKGKFPLILMLRGYVDQKLYKTGDGTRNAASYFAENGFITIAPDFLGYGNSDKEAENIFEARFQTYVTVLSLLKTLEELPNNPDLLSFSNGNIPNVSRLTNSLINHLTVFLWGHSNGGQIALITLEVTGKKYPTALWAPVSKPFPYSILYYTDESDDKGKLIRQELAKFERDYDVEKYSLDNYLDRIKAPLQIHQGTADDAVPKKWTDDLAEKLLNLNLDLNYYVYSGADHNMKPVWNTVVKRDLEFFHSFLK